MSREDRKNQHVQRMFEKQERQRIRKEERKTNAKVGGQDFEKPQGYQVVRSSSSHTPIPNKPIPGRTGYSGNGRQLPGQQQISVNHHAGQNHRSSVGLPNFGALSSGGLKKGKNENDFPPIKVIFAENVEKKNSNLYFFRRKNSFEE